MHRPHIADLPAQPEKASRLAQLGKSVTLCLLLITASAAAGPSAFTWTDANGQVHFGDRPPSDIQAKPVEIRVNTYTAPAQISPEPSTTPDLNAARDSVIIYTTERCGYCRQAKTFMATHRIPFKEYDVENSSRGRADYRKLNGRGVPIILVGEQRMNGYSEGSLASLLRDAGYPLNDIH